MVENIKSSFIMKLLFSYVNEEIKLQLVKYNKKIQNKININLLNYKVMSYINRKNIIIEERNGDTFEYYFGDKIYEGGYLNGKRNGKGKEYDYLGDLKFEGEFLNGKRNGKGEEYYHYVLGCYLIFEGEYINGIRNGKGIDYDLDKNIIFEGEYFNGKKWEGKIFDVKNNKTYEIIKGKGFLREYRYYRINNIFLYEGECLSGLKHGKGKEYFFENKDEPILIFEGEYLCDRKWNGKGYDNKKNILYELKNGKGFVKEYFDRKIQFEGEYLYGLRNGKGKELNFYEGNFLNGYKHGKGIRQYSFLHSYEKFEGEFLYDCRIRGKLFDRKGKLKFEGEFLNNRRYKGKEYIAGRLEFEGEYLNGEKWQGKGYDAKGNIIYELNEGKGSIVYYYCNGDIKFEGEGYFLNGKFNGKGKEYDHKLLVFEGEYLNGKRNGKGKEYKGSKYKRLLFEGEYLNGKKIKGKEFIYGRKRRLICEREYISKEK